MPSSVQIRGENLGTTHLSLAEYRALLAAPSSLKPPKRSNKLPGHISMDDYRVMLANGGKRPGSGKKRNTPEEDLHRACFKYADGLSSIFPILNWLTHYPAGELRKKGVAGKLKAMGVRPGVPDFRLPRRSGCWTGLAVELKSPTGTVSGAQDEWLKALSEEGYLIAVCRTIAEFESIIQRFLAAAHSPRLAPN